MLVTCGPGPLAARIELLTLFARAIVVVLVGLWVLGSASAEVATPVAVPADSAPLTSDPRAAEDGGLAEVIRSLVRALWLVGLLAVVAGFLVNLLRDR